MSTTLVDDFLKHKSFLSNKLIEKLEINKNIEETTKNEK